MKWLYLAGVLNFSSINLKRHGVQFQSFSGSPKNTEEERNLIENAIRKITRAVTKESVKIYLEWQSGSKNKNLLLHN